MLKGWNNLSNKPAVAYLFNLISAALSFVNLVAIVVVAAASSDATDVVFVVVFIAADDDIAFF